MAKSITSKNKSIKRHDLIRISCFGGFAANSALTRFECSARVVSESSARQSDCQRKDVRPVANPFTAMTSEDLKRVEGSSFVVSRR